MVRSALKRAYFRAFDSALPEALPGDIEAGERLRRDLAALPPPNGDGFWNDTRRRLRELAVTEDPRGFMRWEIVARTMVVQLAPYVARELMPLLKDWPRWRAVLKDPVRGHPPPFPFLTGTSANTIHQAYHLHRFERATGVRLEDMQQIVEVGAGYGGLCGLLHKRGFRGRYVIIDSPEFSALQRYYLDALGVSVEHNQQPAANLKTALVATWSLSEMTLADRASALGRLPALSAALIAYQDTCFGIDNLEYFRGWSRASGLRCESAAIKHLPHNYYLFGH